MDQSTGALGVQHFKDQRQQLDAHWRIHNAALKWLRECCENAGRARLDLGHRSTWFIPAVVHGTGANGAEYWFDTSEESWSLWNWHDMLAHLRDSDLENAVNGVGTDRSRGIGITECCLLQTNCYDHKRCHARREITGVEPETMLLEWHFIFFRNDGSWFSLRPSYTKNKVQYFVGIFDDEIEQQEIPASGMGGRGKGFPTFVHFKQKHQTAVMRFDGQHHEHHEQQGGPLWTMTAPHTEFAATAVADTAAPDNSAADNYAEDNSAEDAAAAATAAVDNSAEDNSVEGAAAAASGDAYTQQAVDAQQAAMPSAAAADSAATDSDDANSEASSSFF